MSSQRKQSKWTHLLRAQRSMQQCQILQINCCDALQDRTTKARQRMWCNWEKGWMVWLQLSEVSVETSPNDLDWVLPIGGIWVIWWILVASGELLKLFFNLLRIWGSAAVTQTMPFYLLPWGFQSNQEGHSPRLPFYCGEIEFEIHAIRGWKLHASSKCLYVGCKKNLIHVDACFVWSDGLMTPNWAAWGKVQLKP